MRISSVCALAWPLSISCSTAPQQAPSNTDTASVIDIDPISVATHPADIEWQASFLAGESSSGGVVLSGVEMMHVVNHDGALYAGNSYWGEDELSIFEQRAQLISLRHREGAWALEHRMPFRFTRIESLASIPFDEGDLLIAGAHHVRKDSIGEARIAIRGNDGTWTDVVLGTYTGSDPKVEVRAIGAHRDRVTDEMLAFVGVNPSPLGIYVGRWDPGAPGGIRFDDEPELSIPGANQTQRYIDFVECGDRFFVATSSRILERLDELDGIGPSGKWTELVNMRNETFDFNAPDILRWAEDIRALRCAPDGSEALTFTWLTSVVRLDPDTRTYEKIDTLLDPLSDSVGEPVAYAQAMFDREVFGVRWVGVEVVPESALDGTNWRFLPGGWVAAGLNTPLLGAFRIDDPAVPGQDILVRPRSIADSPWSDCEVYVAGFGNRPIVGGSDLDKHHDTAWVYRAAVEAPCNGQ